MVHAETATCPGPGRSDECPDMLCHRNGCTHSLPDPVETDADPLKPGEALRRRLAHCTDDARTA